MPIVIFNPIFHPVRGISLQNSQSGGIFEIIPDQKNNLTTDFRPYK